MTCAFGCLGGVFLEDVRRPLGSLVVQLFDRNKKGCPSQPFSKQIATQYIFNAKSDFGGWFCHYVPDRMPPPGKSMAGGPRSSIRHGGSPLIEVHL